MGEKKPAVVFKELALRGLLILLLKEEGECIIYIIYLFLYHNLR